MMSAIFALSSAFVAIDSAFVAMAIINFGGRATHEGPVMADCGCCL